MLDGRSILLAEDNDDDALLFKRALRKAGWIAEIKRVSNGQEAIDYLEGKAPFQDRARFPIPALLLLDLQMPHTTGFEFLDWIRTRPDFQHLPIVAVTGSEVSARISNPGELGIRWIVTKSGQYENMAEALKQFCDSIKTSQSYL